MVIKEFINLVQEQTADENGNTWSKADCGLAIEYVTKAIMEAVKNNEIVSIQGFGKFELLDKKERKGVNPRNGEEITISAKKYPKFIPSKIFKDYVLK